jgi:hypothetical protein
MIEMGIFNHILFFALNIIKDILIFLTSGSIDTNGGGYLHPLQTIAMDVSMMLHLYRQIFGPRYNTMLLLLL